MSAPVIQLTCPDCSRAIRAKRSLIGKKIRCPDCDCIFRVTETSANSPATSASGQGQSPAGAKELEAGAGSGSRSVLDEGQDDFFGVDYDSSPEESTEIQNRDAGDSKTSPGNLDKPARKDNSDKRPASRGKRPSAAPVGFAEDDMLQAELPEQFDDYVKAPVRSTRKKKRSSSKRGKQQRDRANKKRNRLKGWLWSGTIAGLIGAVLTILTAFSGMGFLRDLMPPVVGLLVGLAVRFTVKGGSTSGIVAAMVTLLAVILGKAGAFCVPLVEIPVIVNSPGGVFISHLATTVHEEWMTEGRLTEDHVREYWEEFDADPANQRRFRTKDDADYDHSRDHLPEVWAEAERRWTKMSADEQQALRQEVARQSMIEGAEEADAPADVQEEDAQEQSTVTLVLESTFVSMFWPIYSPICIIIGLLAAYYTGAMD